MKEKVSIKVTEEVECFRDCWSYSTETHYTEDWTEEQDNVYELELEMNEDGEILEDNTVIEKKLAQVIDGKLIDFEILY